MNIKLHFPCLSIRWVNWSENCNNDNIDIALKILRYCQSSIRWAQTVWMLSLSKTMTMKMLSLSCARQERSLIVLSQETRTISGNPRYPYFLRKSLLRYWTNKNDRITGRGLIEPPSVSFLISVFLCFTRSGTVSWMHLQHLRMRQ